MPDMLKGAKSTNPAAARKPRVEIAPMSATQKQQQQQIDPYEMIETQRKNIHQEFVDRETKLLEQRLGEKEHYSELDKMGAEYDRRMAPFPAMAEKLKNLQSLIDTGQLNARAGERAKWGLLLPGEAVKSMFPDEDEGGFISKDATAKREILRVAEVADVQPKSEEQREWFREELDERLNSLVYNAPVKYKILNFWNPNKPGGIGHQTQAVPETAITGEYLAMRNKAGYTKGMNDAERIVFDNEFDAGIRAKEGNWNWDPVNNKRIQGLRDSGSLAKMVVAENFALQGELNDAVQGYFVDILGKKAAKAARSEQRKAKNLSDEEIAALLTEAGGDKDKARALALERGRSF